MAKQGSKSNQRTSSRKSSAKRTRRAEPVAPKVSAERLVVGIGASAGGLEAFQTFFDHMPADSGIAFVLVQHLDPNHKSMLVELLRAHTEMTVVEAADGLRVTPNRIFV